MMLILTLIIAEMSKFLPQKKRLLEEVFEKASDETTESSFTGILKYLEITLKDDYNIPLSYKTFEKYYQEIVEQDKDYNIKPVILDDLCKYLDYTNFREYCEEWRTVEHTVTDTPKKIIVHVTNKPILIMPDFLTKQSNIGFLGIFLVGSFLAGHQLFNSTAKDNFVKFEKPHQEENRKIITKTEIFTPKKFVNDKIVEITSKNVNDCMYWDVDHFEIVPCDEQISGKEIIQYQDIKKDLVKIMSPDTLTVENSFGKVWYSKSNNQIEFFTSIGTHPENGKTLKNASRYIIRKYGKQQTPEY